MSNPEPYSFEHIAPPEQHLRPSTRRTRTFAAIAFAALLIPAAVLFFSSRSSSFPGYTYAGDSARHDRIYVNLGSMEFLGGILHAKALYKPRPPQTYDYLIADLFTTCSGNYGLLSATPFKTNGAPMQKLNDSNIAELQEATGIAAKLACAKSDDLQTIPEGFDALRAVEMLYGPVDRVAQTAIWLQPPKPPLEFASFDNTKKYTVHLVSTLDAREGGAQKKYLIVAAYPTGEDKFCHACSTIIGAAEFKLEDSKWHLEAFGPFAARGPGFGADPKTKLIQIGQDRSAVELTTGDMAQGFEDEGIQVLATVGTWVGQVFAHDISSSYDGCDTFSNTSCWSNKTQIQFIPGQNHDYFDIQADTTGTKSKEQSFEAVSANESRTFTLVGHSYR